MSRSYRRTPIRGVTTCESEKADKRRDHHVQRNRWRALRAQERWEDAEANGPGVPLWCRGKDGKSRWSLESVAAPWKLLGK